jgi:hypothetical protein
MGGHVEATLVFAGPDAAVLARRTSEGAAPDLNDAVLHGIDVRADAEPCAAAYRDERTVGGDAVEVHAAFDCPHRPRQLTVSLSLLDELPPSHVHLVRISSGGLESQAVLRSSAASARLLLSAPSSLRYSSARAVALLLSLAALVGVLVARRARKTTRP